MNNKRKLVEESFNKMKGLIENKLNEQPVVQVQPAQQPVQQPAQQQAQQQSNPQRDQQISANIDTTMDQAMNVLVSKLPAVLSQFAKFSGDKDGVIDAPGVYDNKTQAQPQQSAAQNSPQQGAVKPIQEGESSELTFDEGKFMECMGGSLNEGGILGLAISAPAILKYGGQATRWIGKQMDSKWLQKWGNKTAEAGEKLHHKYIHAIEKVLKPLMPSATPEQLHKAANGIFMGAVGVLFAGSLAHPGMLTGIKGAELGQEALAALQKSLPSLGFS